MNILNLPKIISGKIKRVLKLKKNTVEKFHCEYYYSKVWSDTYWLGKKVFKCPLDLWIYQEMIYETKPDVIIESGTFHGGSALYFANLFDVMGMDSCVITIDVDEMPGLPVHNKIIYLHGSSLSPDIVKRAGDLVKDKRKVMVILDSDHSKEHVLKELELYHRFVTRGNYLVVEDSNLNGHPVYSGFGHGPGPTEAMQEFLPKHPEFAVDKKMEKFLMTFNPSGFLKKIS
jgi:cephalosporin hydroxylase